MPHLKFWRCGTDWLNIKAWAELTGVVLNINDSDLIFDLASAYSAERGKELKAPPPDYFAKEVADKNLDRIFKQVKERDRASSNKS